MATIGLLPHPNRQEAVTLAAVTASWLIAEGHRAMVFGAVIPDVPDGSPSERRLASQLDLAVSLGGDGTMLRTVDLVTPFGVPVLGVNVGHLGFLTEIAPAELPQALKQFLAGDYRIE
ncbi:MAG: kinase, partial [Acidimicrobiaceae bacterium]|nr:kinase [Acidimicrobiaceae bacterium]